MSVLVEDPYSISCSFRTNVRICFMGGKCSGKSYALELLLQRLIELSPNLKYQCISLKNVLKKTVGFDTLIARDVCHRINTNLLFKTTQALLNETNDVILIDDVCYDSDAEQFRKLGFKIFVLDPDWNIRFERLRKTYPNPFEFYNEVRWFTHKSELHESELQENCYDYVSKNENTVSLLVEDIIRTL
jgi:hypothetical protein